MSYKSGRSYKGGVTERLERLSCPDMYAGTPKQNTDDMLRQKRGRNQTSTNYGRRSRNEP